MNFRGVEYSPAGEALMRALGILWRGTDDPAVRAGLNSEADVVHAFHESFPGLTIHDSRYTQAREPLSKEQLTFGGGA